MGPEPPIDSAAIQELLEEAYGIRASRLNYRPAEWSVGGYTILAADGECYFLKVQNTMPAGFAATSHDFYLPLTRELHLRGILPSITYPIPTTDGRLSLAYGAYVLILHNYIDGTVLGDEGISDEVLGELGTLLGILHHSITQIVFDHPLTESFQITFRGEFQRAFAAAEHPRPDEVPGIAAFRAALLPRCDEITTYLHVLSTLETEVRSKPPSMVVCHTDVHAWNLMRDRTGNLHLIDWDNAMIAPAEHDLFFFTEDDRFWQVFLPAYEGQVGPARIDPDVLRYYYYRRGLEDTADYLQRILRGDGGTTRDRSDLEGIEDCLAGLRSVEGTIGRIRERLESR